MSGGSERTGRDGAPQRAVLVGVSLRDDRRDRFEPPLAELKRLATTAGAVAVGEVLQRRERPDAATFIGRGKVDEVRRTVEATDAELVLFDNDLSPGQERNLERRIERPVVDRSRLILDIFATRARSRQATLQVELAQLEYQRSRLKRLWTHLERLEGSIGSRGPGETQLESDKRLIAKRIDALRRALRTVERQEATRAASREAFFKASLVGYTNAGKSTLLRRLTGADAHVEDKLFATLDTQTRGWALPGNQRVFLSDTVGFIRDLPHNLVASFHATLAEAIRSDLLLHVVDASHPDAEHHMRVVTETLDEIGVRESPTLVVFNKVDALGDGLLANELFSRHADAARVSARTGEGVAELEERISRIVQVAHLTLDLEVPAGAGRVLAFVASRTNVLEQVYDGELVRLRVKATPRDAARIRELLAEEASGHVAE